MDNLIKIYLQIPEERLGVLLDLDFEKRFIIENKIEKDWIKNKKCECVKKLKEDNILICNHIKKEIKEKTRKIRKKIRKKSSISIYRDLLKFQRNQNRFNSI